MFVIPELGRLRQEDCSGQGQFGLYDKILSPNKNNHEVFRLYMVLSIMGCDMKGTGLQISMNQNKQ